MSRSGLRQLMTTQQMKIQASYLAKYEQVSTLDGGSFYLIFISSEKKSPHWSFQWGGVEGYISSLLCCNYVIGFY